MMDFKFYVIIGIIVAIAGGFIAGASAASGNVVGSIVFLYILPAFAIIIILWGFAGVIDKINDNTERIAELMEYLTDSVGAIGAEDVSGSTPREGQEVEVSYE